MSPELSVVMAAFNQGRFVAEAVESILKQSFTDFEFIIIDDGSTDGTDRILDTFQDSRIVRKRNECNIGLTPSLNQGLRAARGTFVARQDADDISLPLRMEKQITFLREYPEVGLAGCACVLIDQEGKRLGRYKPRHSDIQIRWVSLLTNPFAHPTTMFRRQLVTDHGLVYDESLETTQDYDLWLRMLAHTRGANLTESLVLYRRGGNITTAKRKLQLETQDTIAFGAIRKQFPQMSITPEEVSQLRSLFVGGGETLRLERRIPLAHLYLNLFGAFLNAHLNDSTLEDLKREEALRVARVTLRSAVRPGWPALAKRLLSLDPLVPWSLFCYSLAAFHRLLASRISRTSV
jgi:hypothetical protein